MMAVSSHAAMKPKPSISQWDTPGSNSKPPQHNTTWYLDPAITNYTAKCPHESWSCCHASQPGSISTVYKKHSCICAATETSYTSSSAKLNTKYCDYPAYLSAWGSPKPKTSPNSLMRPRK